jgi:hypothetical protein
MNETTKPAPSNFAAFLAKLSDGEKLFLMVATLVAFALIVLAFAIGHSSGEAQGRPETIKRVITVDPDGRERTYDFEDRIRK